MEKKIRIYELTKELGKSFADVKEILNELNIPVYVAENALKCVAEGTGIMLENLHIVG